MPTLPARRLIGATLRRPALAPLLLRSAWRFRRRGWYRRAPFLPLPPGDYLEWRMQTAYGEAADRASIDELERYLRWALRRPGA